MSEIYEKVTSPNGFAYLFKLPNEISIFFSESFNLDFIKPSLNNIIYSIIKELLINEEILVKNVINLHDNGYLYSFMKIVDGITIKIGVIPKILNLFHSQALQREDLQKINNLLLNVDDLLKSYRTNMKKTKLFKKSNGCLNMVEFETDLLILKSVLEDISKNNIYFPKENKKIFSDSLIGEINIQACRTVREKNILPQYFKVKKKQQIKSLIYSAIFSKYSHKLTTFLKLNKQNKIINDLLTVLTNIQNNSFFDEKEVIYSIPQIKALIIQNKDNPTYKANHKLIANLSVLLDNNINIDEKFNFKKKIIRLEKIWEQFNEEFFAKQFKNVSFQGIKGISVNSKNQIYFGESDSRIDIIWKEETKINDEMFHYYNIADCKYKVLDSEGKPKVEDIDKLKRDSDIHNKLSHKEKTGDITLDEKIILEKLICSYLIYPKNLLIDISTWDNKTLVLNNNVDYFTDEKKLDFSANLEYKDINIFILKVDFLLIKNLID